MNSKGQEIADAIVGEVAEWPGASVEIVTGKNHPKAKLTFGDDKLFVVFAGTPSDAYAQANAIGDVRRALRQLGAERSKPEPSPAEDRAAATKANEGKAKRPDPLAAEPVIQADPKEPLAYVVFDEIPLEKVAEVMERNNPELAAMIDKLDAEGAFDTPDPKTYAGRVQIAEGDGWAVDGEHEMDAERYHCDPCERPSLSASLAKRMIEYSPWHAWTNHPRLNPDYEPQDKLAFRVGRAFHKLMLECGDDIAVLDHRDYKTNAAKADRDQALADGFTPLLAHQFEKIEHMARAAKRQINAREELAYAMAGGVPERVFIWTEQTPAGPIQCRMMADWTPHQGNLAVDFKSTAGSAGPNEWGQKVLWQTGCDIQDAFYRRGWRAVLGRSYDAIIFAVVETEAPWAMMHHRVDPAAQAYADREVQWAINAWGICLHHNRWPGYPREMAWQQRPGWREARIDARYDAGDERDLAALDAELANAAIVASVPIRDSGPATDDPFGLPELVK